MSIIPFADDAKVTLEATRDIAYEIGGMLISDEHLLLALARNEDGAMSFLLEDAKTSAIAIEETVRHHFEKAQRPRRQRLSFSPRMRGIIRSALNIAMVENQDQINGKHILRAFFQEVGSASYQILVTQGMRPQEITNLDIDTAYEKEVQLREFKAQINSSPL